MASDTSPFTPEWLQRLEKVHPHQMLLNLAMVGSGLIFGYLMIAYSYTRVVEESAWQFAVPKPFVVSTVIILVSSFILVQAKRSFQDENFGKLKRYLSRVLLLGILFSALQVWGWVDLLGREITLAGNKASGAYLFLMSGLHLIHLVGGLLYLLFVWYKMRHAAKDPVHSLITATTPYQKVRINMVVTFWHYLDVVWVLLFFFFLFTL